MPVENADKMWETYGSEVNQTIGIQTEAATVASNTTVNDPVRKVEALEQSLSLTTTKQDVSLW